MMKKIFALAALLLTLSFTACKKEAVEELDNNSTQASITGIWELSSIDTKVSIGSVNVSVYIEFGSTGNFTIYQKIGDGRYSKFTGIYTLSTDNTLSGTYSNSSSWGPYYVAFGDNTLSLTSAGGKETDTYKKISAIPETVVKNVY